MTTQDLKDFFDDIYRNNKTVQCLQYPIIQKLAEAMDWVKRDDLVNYFEEVYQQSITERGGLSLDHLWSHRFGKGGESPFLNKLVEFKPVKKGAPKTHYKLKKNISHVVNEYLATSPIPDDKIKSLMAKRIEEVQLNKNQKDNSNDAGQLASTNKLKTHHIEINTILYGPPGTGKTYNTINRALEIIDESIEGKRKAIKEKFDEKLTEGRIVFTTFHQSMTYEDFIEGIKPLPPKENEPVKYEVQDGIFKRLCDTASANKGERYVLIIDEINRGNVSQIFGELITLIEEDKRTGNGEALPITLPYSKKTFSVPSNLYIIGTMNTADRSVEALDAALRRRFSFEEMPPKPDVIVDADGTPKIIDGVQLPTLLSIINSRIEKLLDKDHQIGHSYFMSVEDVDGLRDAFVRKIIPLLQEYFFGDYGKIGLVLGEGFVEKKSDNITFAKFDYDDGASQYENRVVYKVKNLDNVEFISAVKKILPVLPKESE